MFGSTSNSRASRPMIGWRIMFSGNVSFTRTLAITAAKTRRLVSDPCADRRATVRRPQGRRISTLALPHRPIRGRRGRRSWPARCVQRSLGSLLEPVVEVAGPEALEVERDVPVAGGADRGDHVGPALDGAGQVVERHLDPGEVAVVAHPELAEPERPQ